MVLYHLSWLGKDVLPAWKFDILENDTLYTQRDKSSCGIELLEL